MSKQSELDKYWVIFLNFCKEGYEFQSTKNGGVYGRINEDGYDVTENWALIPSETNFWIWYTHNQLANQVATEPKEELQASKDNQD